MRHSGRVYRNRIGHNYGCNLHIRYFDRLYRRNFWGLQFITRVTCRYSSVWTRQSCRTELPPSKSICVYVYSRVLRDIYCRSRAVLRVGTSGRHFSGVAKYLSKFKQLNETNMFIVIVQLIGAWRSVSRRIRWISWTGIISRSPGRRTNHPLYYCSFDFNIEISTTNIKRAENIKEYLDGISVHFFFFGGIHVRTRVRKC